MQIDVDDLDYIRFLTKKKKLLLSRKQSSLGKEITLKMGKENIGGEEMLQTLIIIFPSFY